MGFLFDTILSALPAEKYKQLTARELEDIKNQGEVYSLHPSGPEEVMYIGTRLGKYGEAYDYYQDNDGIYWYESRKATDFIVTKFRFKDRAAI